MISPVNDAAVQVSALLLAAPDPGARGSIIASAIVELLPDCACVVHRFAAEKGEEAWTPVGAGGDISVEPISLKADGRLIAPLLSDSPEPVIYPGSSTRREDYAHLHVSRSIATIAYIPLLHDTALAGALEIVSFSSGLRLQDLETIGPVV